MITEIEVAISSSWDLRTFLELHELEGDAETVWKSIRGIAKEEAIGLSKIIKTWKKDNSTFALTSCCSAYIFDNDVYGDFIKEGAYIYKDYILLFESIGDKLPYLKLKYFNRLKKVGRWRYGLPQPKFSYYTGGRFSIVSEETFMEALARHGYIAYIKYEDIEGNKKRFEEFKRKLHENGENEDITFTDELIIVEKEDGIFKFGVEGKKLYEYIIIPEIELSEIKNNKEPEDLRGFLGGRVYFGFEYYLPDGEYTLYLGKFKLKYEIKTETEKKKRKRFFDGIEVKDFEYALESFREYDNKEKFLKNINNRRKDTVKDKIFYKFSVYLTPYYPINLNLYAEKRKGKWYLEFPEVKKSFYVSGGKRKLLQLCRLRRYCIEISTFYNEVLRTISCSYQSELLECLKDLCKKYKESEERAQRFLNEIIEENKDRIKKGEFEIDHKVRKGYLVKGKVKNYFVDHKGRYVTLYPSKELICLEVRENMPPSDKIASILLSLLNDDRLVEETLLER